MSPDASGLGAGLPHFPRVSGDEPLETAAEETAVEFSPRERG